MAAHERRRQPVVDRAPEIPRITDVVIVGGGIVGASLVYCLSAVHGIATVLFEREALACESSGLSAGTIWNVGKGDGSSLGALLCDETVRLLRDVEYCGYDCAFRQSGALTIACDAEQLALLRVSAASFFGFSLSLIEGNDAVAALEPALRGGSVVGAIHTPLSGHVDPSAATESFAAAAAACGAVIVEGDAVVGIDRVPPPSGAGGAARSVELGGRRRWCVDKVDACTDEGARRSRFVVRTASGSVVAARHVVVAAGAHAAKVARLVAADLVVPVVPVRGQMWSTVETEPSALGKVIFTSESKAAWSKWSSRDDAHGIPEHCTHDWMGRRKARHAYGRRTAEGQIIFGGARIRCAPGAYEVSREVFESNYAHVCEFLPAVGAHEIAGSWTGLMPFSVDGRSIVGELRRVGLPGLWLAAGFGPHGVMEGPGAMSMLANAIAGRSGRNSARFEEIDACREGCVVRAK